MKIFLPVLLAFFLGSCCKPAGSVPETEMATISYDVPGLGQVTRFVVYGGDGHYHYIYKVEGSDQTTSNRLKSSGKSHRTESTTILK